MDRYISNRDNWTRLIVFFIALVVRLVFLFQNLDNPFFFTPIVDAGTYHELALMFAQEGWIGEGFFWQPFLYPFFLGIIYLLTGGSIMAAKLIQIGLGVFTCVCTYELGRRAASRAVGLIAALIVAFYGPMLVFESQLVGAGPAAFMSVVLLLIFLRVKRRLSKPGFFGLGIVSAAAALIRPTFFPFALLALLWTVWEMIQNRKTVRTAASAVCIWTAGFLMLALPVTWMNAGTAEGRWSFLPYSGAVNLYVGNNPDICRTLTVRPGWEWERMLDMPRFQGITSPSRHPAFFRDQVKQYALSRPADFAANLGRKSMRLINSREIPRNMDIYLYRNWSGLLRFLMGKAGPFGWPFGLIFPFVVLAAAAAYRRIRPELWLFLAVHSLALVLVFPASRYRIEMMPVLAIAAGAGIAEFFRRMRRHRVRNGFTLAVILGLSAALSVFPGPFCEEKEPYEAEMYMFLAVQHLEEGHLDQADTWIKRSVRLAPGMSGTYIVWGDLLMRRNRMNESFLRYRQAAQLNPARDDAWRKMGILAYLAGQGKQAELFLNRAVDINPFVGKSRVMLGRVLEAAGRREEALKQYQRSLSVDIKMDKGDKAEALMRVSLLQWGREPGEETLHRLWNAFKLDSNRPEILMSLAWLQAVYPQNEVKDTRNAVNMAREAWRIKSKDAFILDVLGAALASAGHYKQAAEAVKQALTLAEDRPDPHLLQQELALRLDAYVSGNPWISRRPPSWYRYSR